MSGSCITRFSNGQSPLETALNRASILEYLPYLLASRPSILIAVLFLTSMLASTTFGQESRPSLTQQKPIKEETKSFKSGGGLELNAEDSPTATDIQNKLIPFVEQNLKPATESPELKAPIKVTKDGHAVQQIGKRWVANWTLNYNGIPLSERSNVTCTVAPNGSMSLRSRNLPLSMEQSINQNPTKAMVPLEKIEAAAKEEIQKIAQKKDRSLNVQALKALDYQPDKLEIWVDPESQKGYLAQKVVLTGEGKKDSKDAIAVWVTVGNPAEAKIVGVQDLVHHDHKGTVRGPIWDPTPLDQLKTIPLANVRITRQPELGPQAEMEDKVFSDKNGKFQFGGSGSTKLIATLKSDFFVIVNAAGSLQRLELLGNETSPFDFSFHDGGEFEIAQVSAYHWAHKVREFAGPTLGDNQLKNVTIKVNTDGECNAFFSQLDMSLSLFKASPSNSTRQCCNRAYRDTIFHEYGHAIDFACNGILDGGYSEGLGDSLAILFKNQSCYGSSCCGAGSCLRDAAEAIIWPDQSDGEVHDQGRVYAGFTWELIQQLQASGLNQEKALQVARDLTLQACKANPSSIPNAITLIFEADDDDADLENGTPHFKAIAKAADSRQIPRPANPTE